LYTLVSLWGGRVGDGTGTIHTPCASSTDRKISGVLVSNTSSRRAPGLLKRAHASAALPQAASSSSQARVGRIRRTLPAFASSRATRGDSHSPRATSPRSEEHTSELQSRENLV